MTPAEVTAVLREKGMCGRVSEDAERGAVACLLAIGHDDGEHEDPAQRWEDGFRSIVTILLGPSVPFEIRDVVEMVRQLRRAVDAGRKACPRGPLAYDGRLHDEIEAYDGLERKARSSPSWAARNEQRARSYDGRLVDEERCVCGGSLIGHLDGPAGRIPFCVAHEEDAHALAKSMGATIYTREPL